ncbi:hypothetical protein HYV85_03185, partial [Candidatus Woesearchaeota archaeon]|nr:hypothetical protein [Candidatus Woesearchaeota archaeon]
KIPDIILKSPHSIMRSFLRAYFDGDGSATKRGFEVTTKNHFVALQLQSMLLRFGITSVLRKRMCRATNSAMQPKPYTALMIYDTHNLAKLSSIGFSIPRKMERLLQLQGKKPQSNIDKVPHIWKLIFELKEKLRLTSEDIGIGVHQFQRYLQGTRTPTLATVQKATKVFSQRFVALRTIQPRILTDGSLDLGQLTLELGMSKTALANMTGRTSNQIEQALSAHDASVTACIQALVSECVSDEVENKLIGLYQLASADVVWERITKITDAGVQELYDFEAENTHNFLANNIFVHNSMMGMAMAELLPREKLVDALAFANPNDENQPMIRVVPAGKGRDVVSSSRLEAGKLFRHQNVVMIILLVTSLILPWWAFNHYSKLNPLLGGIMFMSFSLVGLASLVSFVLFLNLGRRMENKARAPKVIVDNFNKKTAPFHDATGAHAGALLGDVLHDPFQSFIDCNIYVRENNSGGFVEKPLGEIVAGVMDNHRDKILKKEGKNYEALYLEKDELLVFGETNGTAIPIEALSVNRYDYDGEMIKLTTSENSEISVTPEHKIAVWEGDKIKYVEAREIQSGYEIAAKTEDVIVDEDDIINTYDAPQQEQCRLYYEHRTIKAQNPSWGYKRIAKAMGQKIGKTRWWHERKHIPVPIQTANCLKERGLLPLKIDNPKLPLIAKMLGATFGDGGIFENLNGIFLSSSEKEAVEEFGKDLEEIFNLDRNKNSRIIEGGVYGHSWCYQNTNRNIIRFFLALGAPRGNKTSIELKVPAWIYLNEKLEDNFYGSFFGSELGSPSQHIEKNRLTGLEVGVSGKHELEPNRMDFLQEISDYLSKKGIATGSVYKGKIKESGNTMYRLLMSTRFDNILKFMIGIKLNYCEHKAKRLYLALGKMAEWKKSKYYELIERGYGAEHIMKLLKLTPNSLYLLLNHFGPVEKEAVAV